MGNEFIHVHTYDWEGIYINGVLEYEGHDTPTYVSLDILRKNNYYIDVKLYRVHNKYMNEVGNFPDKFEDIPKEVLL